jgi:hypothetical protein
MACSTLVGVEVVKVVGTNFLVAFTSAGGTFAAPAFSCARRWIWRSQCLRQLLFQVVDDDVLEVVNVLLLGINSWWIHPLRETAVLSLGGVLQKASVGTSVRPTTDA